jgi:hypothetical protein
VNGWWLLDRRFWAAPQLRWALARSMSSLPQGTPVTYSSCRCTRILHLGEEGAIMNWAQPNNTFERPVTQSIPARGQRVIHSAPSARWRARRPAAQRER